MVLTNRPLCWRCGVQDETTAHILRELCESEAFASLGHAYLGFFFLDPEDIKSLSLGAETLAKEQGSLNWYQVMGHKGPVN